MTGCISRNTPNKFMSTCNRPTKDSGSTQRSGSDEVFEPIHSVCCVLKRSSLNSSTHGRGPDPAGKQATRHEGTHQRSTQYIELLARDSSRAFFMPGSKAYRSEMNDRRAHEKSVERFPFDAFHDLFETVAAICYTGRLHKGYIGLFKFNKWAHSASFRKQLGLFGFVLGRGIACSHLGQTCLALPAASDLSLSFSTSHEPQSPDLLKKRGQCLSRVE